MKQSVRATMAFIAVPLTLLLFTGCSKKAVKPADDGTKISQGLGVTKDSRGDRATKDTMAPRSDQSDQLLALRGEDIPISEAPSLEFRDLTDEERMILKPVYFDYDRSSIRPEFQPVLEGAAGWLNDRPEMQLLIEGHCDERGTDEYNLALGERRALSVRRYLVGLGIAPDRLHTISYGEEQPEVMGGDEAAWAKNRRAEFKVSAN